MPALRVVNLNGIIEACPLCRGAVTRGYCANECIYNRDIPRFAEPKEYVWCDHASRTIEE